MASEPEGLSPEARTHRREVLTNTAPKPRKPSSTDSKRKTDSETGPAGNKRSRVDLVPEVLVAEPQVPPLKGSASALLNPIPQEASKAKPPKSSDQGTQGPPILPWMQHPVEISSAKPVALGLVRSLHSSLRAKLEKEGFANLFPVQAAAWNLLAGGFSTAHDLCICAPTGSGKTLAYALPIIQSLSRWRRQQLGALIVLPTRELAYQVYEVFAGLSPAVQLWTGVAAARLPMAAESKILQEACLNILVATPGRLMAHLRAEEPLFSLSYLRFLVVDETDRLLRQSYQDWLPFVLQAAEGSLQKPRTSHARLVKIVLSATLTQDPSKIGRLQLHAPRYISLSATDNRYKVPKQLREFKVVCAAADKPLMLMALLQHLSSSRIIVFAGSLAATDRLAKFLRVGLEIKVAVHSSMAEELNERETGLFAFKKRAARVLVASDALTRGMDVPGVDVVINYDQAAYPKTYVHRAGRTARADLPGTVISLLTGDQVRHFKAMLRKLDNAFVKDFDLPPNLANSLRPACQQALGQLEEPSQP